MSNPAFPRTYKPLDVSWPALGTGLITRGQNGRVQRRQVTRLGATWQEQWNAVKLGDTGFAGFLAYLRRAYSQQTIFDVDHLMQRAIIGTTGGAATITVNGVAQSGGTLNVAGLPVSVSTLAAGDILRVVGIPFVLTVAVTAVSDGAGRAALAIDPPIPASYSPADTAVITTNGAAAGSVVYQAMIAQLSLPTAGKRLAYDGLAITWQEAW